jgi:predicted metalloprotease with PDZ domain
MSQWAPFGDGGNSVAQSNAQNIFVSYYPYGAALGLGIDLAIRSEFPGKSLDDWMRAMWQRHGRYQKDYKPERPYTMADLEQALASVTSAEFASRIFRKHVRGKEPMDYAALLEKAGFLLRNAPGDPWLGSTALRFAEDGATLTGGTVRGSPLYEAGIDRGHRITELDGKPIRKNEDLTAWLKSREPGDTVKAKVVTHLGPRDLTFTLAAKPAVEVLPFEAAGRTLSPQQNALRQSWLSSKAKRPLPELRRYCSHGVTVPFEFNFCPNDGKPSQITPAADSSK